MFLGVAVAGDFCGFFLRSLSQSRIDYVNIDERVFFCSYIQKKFKRTVNSFDCVVFCSLKDSYNNILIMS